MTDLLDMLPRREFPVLAPPPGGFDAALGMARHRRRRQLGLVATATALAGVLVGSVQVAQLDGSVRVGITDQPGITEPVFRLPDKAVVAPPAAVDEVAQAFAPPGRKRTVVSGSPTTTVPAPQPAKPKPASRPADTPSEFWHPAKLTKSVSSTPIPCSTGVGSASIGWTMCAQVNRSPGDSGKWDLSLDICRSTDDQSPTMGTLRFTTTQFAQFRILSMDNKPLWTWTYGLRFVKKSGTQPVSPGGCVTWTMPKWNKTDDPGYFLDAGNYTLVASSTAKGFEEFTAQTPITVD